MTSPFSKRDQTHVWFTFLFSRKIEDPTPSQLNDLSFSRRAAPPMALLNLPFICCAPRQLRTVTSISAQRILSPSRSTNFDIGATYLVRVEEFESPRLAALHPKCSVSAFHHTRVKTKIPARFISRDVIIYDNSLSHSIPRSFIQRER